MLAVFTTWYDRLPMGAPTSPVVANFYCIELDRKLTLTVRDNRFVYSRYADDLTFLSDIAFTNDSIVRITDIIHDAGFTINSKKFRINSYNSRQMVTGLVGNKQPNVKRSYIRTLRAMLNDIEKNGLESAAKKHFRYYANESINPMLVNEFRRRLLGKIQFVGFVKNKSNPVYKKLINRYRKIFAIANA